jgi:hypothetical protein
MGTNRHVPSRRDSTLDATIARIIQMAPRTLGHSTPSQPPYCTFDGRSRVGDDRHDVLDFLLESVMRPRRKLERPTLGAGRDVFHDDRAKKPAGHRLAETVDADPPACCRWIRREAGDHLDAATLVRRAASHRQIAERVPHVVPGHAPIAAEFQPRRSHRHGLHVLVRVLILLRKQGFHPELENLERQSVVFAHRHSGNAPPFGV